MSIQSPAVLPLILTFLQAGPPPDKGPVFEVVSRVGSRVLVSSGKTGVSAYMALRDLEKLGAFKLNLQLPAIRSQLESESLNLFFQRKDAVSVAELIAVAAGLDVQEERLEPRGGEKIGKVLVTVVTPPLSRSEEGKKSLRQWALRWYERFLVEPRRNRKETFSEESRVTIDMALLNLAQGELLSAAEKFDEFLKRDGDHPFASRAQLKRAECLFELEDFETCIRETRRVLTTKGRGQVGAEAAVLFARANLALAAKRDKAGQTLESSKTLDNLVQLLDLFLSGFRDKDQFARILLLLGEAHRRRGRPELVLEKVRQVETAIAPIELSDRDWVSLNFLRGVAEVYTGEYSSGEKYLWHFVRRQAGDPRGGAAWLAISEAETALQDPLQALFASRMALRYRMDLLPEEETAVRFLGAKALLSLGKFNEAIESLEILAQGPKPDVDILVFLGRTLLDEGKPERAKRLFEGMERVRGIQGDRIRLMILEAEKAQRNYRKVVEKARKLAIDVVDPEIQKKVSEIVGDAYSALGEKELAAESYNGRIR